MSKKQAKKSERNEQIRARFAAGEGLADLGREFQLTPQRVYQIVHEKRK